ncbi:unnamed protein product [Cylindrotheca closterium]|uniref:Uncharacterized protein n=1 Tax=Cylindrotheca closterium TaxID=2856 RepID=A0AAD2FMC1_9STRA|nr:unnamed protein product [Cylindrotheca closterium]
MATLLLANTESLTKLVAQFNCFLLDKEGEPDAYRKPTEFTSALSLIATKTIEHTDLEGQMEYSAIEKAIETYGRWLFYSESSCSDLVMATDKRTEPFEPLEEVLNTCEVEALTSKPWTQLVYIKENIVIITGRSQQSKDPTQTPFAF